MKKKPGVYILIGVVLFIVGIIWTGIAQSDYKSAVQTSGEVTKCVSTTRFNSTRYITYVTYVVDEKKYEGTLDLSYEMSKGAKIDFWYQPETPLDIKMSRNGAVIDGLFITIVGFMIGGYGVVRLFIRDE